MEMATLHTCKRHDMFLQLPRNKRHIQRKSLIHIAQWVQQLETYWKPQELRWVGPVCKSTPRLQGHHPCLWSHQATFSNLRQPLSRTCTLQNQTVNHISWLGSVLCSQYVMKVFQNRTVPWNPSCEPGPSVQGCLMTTQESLGKKWRSEQLVRSGSITW